nr:MAG TPA: hypothetical protein [Podoviridae sp. ctfN46]
MTYLNLYIHKILFYNFYYAYLHIQASYTFLFLFPFLYLQNRDF